MFFIKTILMLTFLLIFLQDIKERQVYWFLFPIIGFLSGILFYKKTLPELFFSSVITNMIFIFILIFVIFLYTKFKLNTKVLDTIGLGDLALFFVLSVSFSSISFISIFISALIFSLILHLFLVKTQNAVTVPLAGYMSLFFLLSYICYWTGFINNVYTI